MTPKQARAILLKMYPERCSRHELTPRINNKGNLIGAFALNSSILIYYRNKKYITPAQYDAAMRFLDRLPAATYQFRDHQSPRHSDAFVHIISAVRSLLSPIKDPRHAHAVIEACVYNQTLPMNQVPHLRLGLRKLAAEWRM